jgi:hypothetical protein
VGDADVLIGMQTQTPLLDCGCRRQSPASCAAGAAVVKADIATTWDALMEGDLIEVGRKRPLVGVLGAIRILPDIVSHMLITGSRRPTCSACEYAPPA